ncbi:MAG: hydroxymethylglutaryl-CoA synthase [Deltaproteobacteria bacterium]|nr:hydroxymethylglutaryl-CoA synthase [Deltaproteobacteria bacterium]
MKLNSINIEPKAGIDAISIFVPNKYFSLETLAKARNVDKEKYTIGLGCKKMSVLSPFEDPVTMAANAGMELLEKNDIDPDEIGYVIVGTETGIDASKPIAVYIHEMLGLNTNCRCIDIKNACYAGTAALRNALHWTLSPGSRGKKALVVTTDVAFYNLRSAGEPTQGAGAAALLVSKNPGLLSIDLNNESVYTREVMDFWRPNYSNTAIVRGHYSLECYLEALEHTYKNYKKYTNLSFDDFSHFIFHTPFPKMASKAFKQMLKMENIDFDNFDRLFSQKVANSLIGGSELGNVYTSSLFLALNSLIEFGQAAEGRRIGLFSYGSGSSAEFLSGFFEKDISQWSHNTSLTEKLKNREAISYDRYVLYRAAYEQRMKEGYYGDDQPSENSRFVFRGVKNHQRQYSYFPCTSSKKEEIADQIDKN